MSLPNAPTSVTLIRQGLAFNLGIFLFSWATDNASDTYNVYEVNVDGSHVGLIQGNLAATSTEIYYELTGAGTSLVYKYFAVTAVNFGGESTDSAILSVIFPEYPGANSVSQPSIADVSATAGSTSVSLTWTNTPNTPWLDRYSTSTQAEVTCLSTFGVTGGSAPYTVTIYGLANAATIGSLTPSSSYSIRLRNPGPVAIGYTGGYNDGAWSDPVTFSTASSTYSLLSGPGTIYVNAGVPVVVPWVYSGTGTVPSAAYWNLANAPSGISLSLDTADLSNKTVVIGGTASTHGRYDATISVTLGDQVTIVQAPIVFYVSDATYFWWFHGDPSHVDLQADVRSRMVTSMAGNNPSGGGDSPAGALELFYEETETVWIILKDGARVANDYPALDELLLFVRYPGGMDLEPFAQAQSAGPAAQQLFSGNVTYPLSVECYSESLKRIFDAANASIAPNPAGEQSLSCVGELRWRLGAQWISSKSFVVTIYQSYAL